MVPTLLKLMFFFWGGGPIIFGNTHITNPTKTLTSTCRGLTGRTRFSLYVRSAHVLCRLHNSWERRTVEVEGDAGDVMSNEKYFARWWFQIFFIFTPIWGRFPI